MKGIRALTISILALLIGGIAAAAQEAELTDSLKHSVVSAVKPHFEQTGLVQLDQNKLLATPALLGVPDIIKTIQTLPGVASGMELFSGLYVHGGDGSDNLIHRDGVPVFPVTHMGGLFSSFNADIVNSIDFYKSGIPSRYGGRSSSVLEIMTKEGSLDKTNGSFSIGLTEGRINLNGPLIKNKLTYNIALRRSLLEPYLITYLALVNSNDQIKTRGGYSLSDINLALAYTPYAGDKVTFKVYSGGDRLRFSRITSQKFYGESVFNAEDLIDARMNWGNSAVSANWDHILSDDSNVSTIIYHSGSRSDLSSLKTDNELKNEQLSTESGIESIKGNVKVTGFRSIYNKELIHNKISSGIECQLYHFTAQNIISRINSYSDTLMTDVFTRYTSVLTSAFVEDCFSYGPLRLETGLRIDIFHSDNRMFINPQPRISTSCRIKDKTIIKASYESIRQYLHHISSLYLDIPTNIWMPSVATIKPTESRQVVLGLFSQLSPCLHMDLSAFYKTTDNCKIYVNNAFLFPDISNWETGLFNGEGRAYGSELSLCYSSGKIHAALYYTLSWNERKFVELYPYWFKDRFDNRHKITLTGEMQINKNININACWTFHSGNRITVPEHIVTRPDNTTELLFSEPYNAKIPDYHRLDISCNFSKTTRNGNLRIWCISLYNAYCHLNPIMMRTTFDNNNNATASVYSLIPIIPSVSYSLIF